MKTSCLRTLRELPAHERQNATLESPADFSLSRNCKPLSPWTQLSSITIQRVIALSPPSLRAIPSRSSPSPFSLAWFISCISSVSNSPNSAWARLHTQRFAQPCSKPPRAISQLSIRN